MRYGSAGRQGGGCVIAFCFVKLILPGNLTRDPIYLSVVDCDCAFIEFWKNKNFRIVFLEFLVDEHVVK